MKDEERNLAIMTKMYNYNKWLYDNFKDYVGNRVLEIGAGQGAMTEFFISKELVIGTEINPSNIKIIKKRFNKRNFKVLNHNISKGFKELKKYKFDTAIVINVLEHIRNDKKAVENIFNLLEKGGKFILVVPAFQFLYGSVDKVDGHYRRYNKNELRNMLEECDFKIRKQKYMNFVGLFGWFYHNKILKLKVHKEEHLSLFNKLSPLLSSIEKIMPPPIGLSLIFIGEKI